MAKRNGKLKELVEKLNSISQSRSELLDKLWLLEQEGNKLRIEIQNYIDNWTGSEVKDVAEKVADELKKDKK